MKKLMLITLIFCQNIVFGQDAGFTGYATSTITGDDIEYKTSGFKDKERTQNYDTLTVQPIGSVSKIIIGLAIMKAIELGFVNLETDINQYLNFEVINPNVKHSQQITLKHLATHTSGIKDNEKFYIQGYTKGLKSLYTLEEFLESYFTKDGERFSKRNFGKYPAGEEYNYSNFGAALAAYVIESASEMPFDQFTEKYLFQPLGLQHTHWFYDDIHMDKYSQLFDEKDKPLDFYSLTTYPDGGLKTNIVDLSKLLKTIINGYQGKSEILNDASWKVFFGKNFSETNPIKGIDPSEPNSGIFIIYAKSGAIGHTGSDPGVCSILFFNPESLQGKVFMANEDLTPQNINSFKTIWENL